MCKRVVAKLGIEIMRAIAILAAAATLVAHAAQADVKRHASIPEQLSGSWAPIADACKNGDKAIVVMAAKSYTSPQANCTVIWVSETAAARGPVYSAHLQCSKTNDNARK